LLDPGIYVHSVGSSRLLAGGAGELVGWPEWLLKAAVLSFAVGAPVEASCRSVVFASLASHRRRGACRPRAGVRVLEGPTFVDLVGSVRVDQAGVVGRRAGWRCFGAEERRLPFCLGTPSSPSKVWWSSGGFRRRGVLRVEDDVGAQEDLIVIFFVSWAV
jgi:hypothetical protein